MAIAMLVASACGSDESKTPTQSGAASQTQGPDPDAGFQPIALESDAGHSYAQTFTAVYGEVLQPTCSTVYCHNAGSFLDLSDRATAHAALVGVAANGTACRSSGYQRVVAGSASESLLYLKLSDPAPCGARMPNLPTPESQLDPQRLAQIAGWIDAGAPND